MQYLSTMHKEIKHVLRYRNSCIKVVIKNDHYMWLRLLGAFDILLPFFSFDQRTIQTE